MLLLLVQCLPEVVPLGGWDTKGKLGGNLPLPGAQRWSVCGGRLGDKRAAQAREVEGTMASQGWGSVARPAHYDKEPHMNGHHFV